MKSLKRARPRFGHTTMLLGVVVGLCAGCGDKLAEPAVLRDAAVYESALLHLIDSSGVELSDRWADPVVFVETLEPESVDLETQIAVVDGFQDEYRIRFVDEISEAVDFELPDLAVREGTLLVAFGPIVVDGDDLLLHGEYYLGATDAAAFDYRFQADPTGNLVMVGDPVDGVTELVVADA